MSQKPLDKPFPDGSGYRAKTRFAKFFNIPELMATFKMAADIQTADMLKLPVPKANFHTEVVKPSPLQQEMIKGLADRAEKIRTLIDVTPDDDTPEPSRSRGYER